MPLVGYFMIIFLEKHPFHIVVETPWPILLGISTFFLLSSLVFFFQGEGLNFLIFRFLLQSLTLFCWGRDVVREGRIEGFHTLEVEKGIKWGIGWFIISEIFFFLAFFWGFFHFSLSPNLEIGDIWPPLHISPISPFAIPLLNTLILLRSGVSLTWAHHSVISGDFKGANAGLFITIFLGVYFTLLQLFEYMERRFCFFDSSYGRVFFLATGFHGCHVIIGTFLLIISLFRSVKNQFIITHHIGLETASWYWHFVDVVWLFLFCCLYWWGR